MAHIRKGWRVAAIAGAAALALALVTSAFAQAPPPGPHAFYGSGAMLDGEPAPDGSVVLASNQDGASVGLSTISGGVWMIDVDTREATSVTFSIDGSNPSESYPVTQFSDTEVALDLTSPAPEPEEPVTEPEEPVTEPEEPVTEPEEPVTEPEEPEEPEEPVVEPVEPETPAALPNTGSGGLADTGSGFPLLPVALVISALVALGGVAVTRRAGIGAR